MERTRRNEVERQKTKKLRRLTKAKLLMTTKYESKKLQKRAEYFENSIQNDHLSY